MIIYKLIKLDNNMESEGYEYFSSKTKAVRAFSKFHKGYDDESEASLEEIEFTPTLKNVVELLNKHASHNDNG